MEENIKTTTQMLERHADTRRMRGQEIEVRRGERSKTFALGRGMYQTVIYAEPIHFRSKKGDWHEIDNQLRSTANNEWMLENTTGPVRVRVGRVADANPLVSMQNESRHSLRWRLVGAKGASGIEREKWQDGSNEDENRAHADKSISVMRYAEALPHTDLILELRGDGVKEAFVLHSPDAPGEYQCALDIGALAWEETEGGGLRLSDEKNPGVDVYRLPSPYMVDAAGTPGKVSTQWKTENGQLLMTITPDAEFLRHAQYPVIIDPTVQSGQVVAQTGDTYISETNKTANYGAEQIMRIGKHSGYGECKALVKISDLPTLSSAYTVAKAWMSVAVLPTKDHTEDARLYAHEVLSNWAQGTANWNSQPTCDSKHLDDALIKKGEAEAKGAQLDITNLVRKWYGNKSANYGVLLDSHEGQPITLCSSENTAYTSTARPVIYVNYVSKAGLEGYLTYESFGAGRAGTAHVALHSGHLVVSRGLTSMSGNRMPVSLGLTWNACHMNKNAFGVGNGWRLSASQSLRREKPQTGAGGGETYYIFTDEDGTEHEFRKHEKTEEEKKDTAFVDYYGDRSGLSLKLYEVGAEAEIVSKGHSKIVFDKPTADYTESNNAIKMIKRALDAVGNTATFTHDSSLRLTRVTDGAGRATTLVYSATRVEITVPGYAQKVALTLDGSQCMTSVTDLDGERCEYVYVGGTDSAAKNRLLRMRNMVDDYCMEPTYDSSGRVIKMRTYAMVGADQGENGREVDGNARGYEYFDCVTQVKDLTVPDGKMLTYQFNDYGNVVAVHDELGFAAFAKFGNTGKPNSPEAVSKLQKLVINLLDAHDFGEDSGWKTGIIGADGMAQENETTYAMSLKPLCLERPGTNEISYAEYQKNCAKGEYTFSVYTRSRGDALAWAEVAWQDENLEWHAVTSERVRRVGTPLRLSCTIDLPEATLVRCRLLAGEGSGAVWFDRAQLEKGALANRHNLIRNANFTVQDPAAIPKDELPAGWLIDNGGSEPGKDDTIAITAAEDSPNKPKDLGANCLRMPGAPGKNTMVYQELDIRGEKEDNYVVGGWCRAWAAPAGEKRTFRLRVRFQKKNGQWVDGGTADWNEEWVDWQYACGAAVAPEAYRRIRVYIEYGENLNEAQIGVVSLVKEHYGQNYAYDEKDNITAVSTLLGEKNKAEYDKFDNLISYVEPGREEGDQYKFAYGETDAEKKRHLAVRSETPLGMIAQSKYDGYGNPVRNVARSRTDPRFMWTSTAYTSDGNYTVGGTDARRQTTSVHIDPNKGVTLSASDATGQTVNYTYDEANRVTGTETTADGKGYRNAYSYEKDRLRTVSHNSTGDTADVTYTFETDPLGNQTAVKVGEQLLSENRYTQSGDKLLEAVTYGNGGKVSYTYDSFKRTAGIRYDEASEPRFTYEYGANGAVGRVRDRELGREARMAYDLAERPVEAELYEDGALAYRLTQEYDRFNQPHILHERVEEADDTRSEHTSTAAYDKESRPVSLTYENARMTAAGQPDEVSERKLAYEYDGLGRVETRSFQTEESTPLFESRYTYEDGGYGQHSTTSLVKTIRQAGLRHEYTYDSRGNITREIRHGKAMEGGELSFDERLSTGLFFEGNALRSETQETLTAVDALFERPIVYDGPGNARLSYEEQLLDAEEGGMLAALLESVDNQPLTLDVESLGFRSMSAYEYDALGQLTRVNDQWARATWTYAYDRGGNIVEKKRYAYTMDADLSGHVPEEIVPYGYGDANWKDKLTRYGGKAITYDAIGNPLTYDGWTYTWKAGRMLHSMAKEGVNAEFTYDHTGLRVKKSVNGVDTLYTMNGKRITHIRKGTSGGYDLNNPNSVKGPNATRMHFFYDAQGKAAMVQYNGADYAYLHNLQGDVTGLVDMDGVMVVQYGYDVWGRPLRVEGSMAETLGRDNPFRYRGYVWDEETGLYYLRSRYYNPAWGRFLNADEVLGRIGRLLSHNLYSYCINSPVMMIDSSGTDPVVVPNGIINWQADFSSEIGTFGPLGSMKMNGCGAIAIHNVNILLGREDELEKIISEINEKGACLLGGALGTLPRFIPEYFASQGDSVTTYFRSKVSTGHDAYIVWYVYKNISTSTYGSHFAAASFDKTRGESGMYVLYNDGAPNPQMVRSVADFATRFTNTSEKTYITAVVYGITKPKAMSKVARTISKAAQVIRAVQAIAKLLSVFR